MKTYYVPRTVLGALTLPPIELVSWEWKQPAETINDMFPHAEIWELWKHIADV